MRAELILTPTLTLKGNYSDYTSSMKQTNNDIPETRGKKDPRIPAPACTGSTCESLALLCSPQPLYLSPFRPSIGEREVEG